jgi:Ca2+-binding RTX toxin-like protein
MRTRTFVLTAAIACSPVLVTVPAEAVTTCGGLTATIVGTNGKDSMTGTQGRDVVNLLGGNDEFNGAGGDDVICGGPGKDRIFAGAGNDRIYGDAGNDYIVEGDGNDRIVGGAGGDYLTYFVATSGVTVTNGNTIDGLGHDVTDVEIIEGSKFADRMTGGAGADDLRGLSGNDTIDGAGGNDFLTASAGIIRGGTGDDFVDASGTVKVDLGPGTNGARLGTGSPTVNGGPEQDRFSFRTKRSHGTVRGGGGVNDQIIFMGVRTPVTADVGKGVARWKRGDLRFSGIHTLIGTRRNDTLIGSKFTDILQGRAGNDVLRLGGGNDLGTGQGGTDSVDGGSGLDYCYGETLRRCEGSPPI